MSDERRPTPWVQAEETASPDARLPAAMSSSLANLRSHRHGQLLERWPVLPEPWALAVERTRVAAIDRTPGPATFGR